MYGGGQSYLKKWKFYFLLFFKIKIMFGSHKVLMKNNKKNIFFKLGFHLMIEKLNLSGYHVDA